MKGEEIENLSELIKAKGFEDKEVVEKMDVIFNIAWETLRNILKESVESRIELLKGRERWDQGKFSFISFHCFYGV
jgi:hypothetical protein